MITPDYVKRAIARDIPAHQKSLLEQWIGKTIKEALALHMDRYK